MSMSHKLAASALLLGAAMALTSCSSNKPGGQNGAGTPTKKGNRRIVFIFKSAGQYAEACKKGQVQADKELSPKGTRVEFLAPDAADAGKQIGMIDQQIASKADAIIVSPNDDKAVTHIIEKAINSGVKVFTWDSDAPASKRIFYVAAADDVQIGIDIADALAKDIGGKGKVAIMSGGRGAANLNAHVDGMLQCFKKYPGITVVQPILYNDDSDVKARSMATGTFLTTPDLAGFACANSPTPPAIGETLGRLNKIGKVKVWGLSLPSLTRSYLKSGAISGIKLWDPGKLTYLAAMLANDYLDGKKPVDGANYPNAGKITVKGPQVLMPGVTFTKDNVDQYNF